MTLDNTTNKNTIDSHWPQCAVVPPPNDYNANQCLAAFAAQDQDDKVQEVQGKWKLITARYLMNCKIHSKIK